MQPPPPPPTHTHRHTYLLLPPFSAFSFENHDLYIYIILYKTNIAFPSTLTLLHRGRKIYVFHNAMNVNLIMECLFT